MKEPSVLDYLKSKIAFWSHSSIEIPPLEQEEVQRVDEMNGTEETPAADGTPLADGGNTGARVYTAAPVTTTAAQRRALETGRLLTLGGLLLALVAQLMLEPPNRAWLVAVFFYIFAAILVGIAYFWNTIHPAEPEQAEAPELSGVPEIAGVPEPQGVPEQSSLPESTDGPVQPGVPGTPSRTENPEVAKDPRAEGLMFNFFPLAASWFFMALTFLSFGKTAEQDVPHFNFFNTSDVLLSLNTTFWLLSIVFMVWAFYLPGGQSQTARLRNRLVEFFKDPGWHIRISRWTVLLLLVVGVVLFFRFYRLDSLPNEAVSDQAEKLLDVYDVLHGETRVFFPRNTGREAFQFYWTALIARLFNTGVTFFSLKLGTTLIGLLTLYYIYRLGKEIGNRWVALLALLFCGFSYWAQTQARIGLRFPLYAGFYAPLLFYLIRGLRSRNRNDFIWAGVWLGIGLHGYTSYRIVPLVVLAAVAIYMLHHRSPQARSAAAWGLVILALVSLVIFMPLLRFSLDNWDLFALRAWSRLGPGERELPGAPVLIFLQNSWNALTMFFWDNGDVWVHSVPHRPALDIISAALFFLGLVLLVLRYFQKRNWVDLFLLVSIPLLLLPSILSLAFPNENPNLNRTSAAYVPVFLIVAIGMEALLSALKRSFTGRGAWFPTVVLGLGLVLLSARANFDLVFRQYDQALRLGTWDSTEMGEVVRQFSRSFGPSENAWVVAYPYWVDTRLVGINAGYPTRDTSIFAEDLPMTMDILGNKLFILNPEDAGSLAQLQAIYPEGRYWLRKSEYPGKDFVIFMTLGTVDLSQFGEGSLLPLNIPVTTGQ